MEFGFGSLTCISCMRFPGSGNKIRYASRKARTYDRFVKADETYDYDPLLAGNT